MGADIDQGRIKASFENDRIRWRVIPTTVITKYQIVARTGISTTGSQYMTVAPASITTSTYHNVPLYMALHATTALEIGKPALEVSQQVVFQLPGTSDFRDPQNDIFLSTNGAFVFQPDAQTHKRLVGQLIGTDTYMFDGRIHGAQQNTDLTPIIGASVMTTTQNTNVAVGTGFNGCPCIAVLGTADGTNAVRSCGIVGGTLTIRLAAVPGAPVALHYFIYSAA